MNSERASHRAPHRKLTVAQFILLASFLSLCVTGVVFSTAQSPEKEEREVQDKIPAHLPIKIKIKKPEKVKDLANDRWLADLEIEVKNTGTKPIYFLHFIMEFVDVKRDSGANIGYGFQYGRNKLVDVTGELATQEDVPILPGETHVFELHEDYVKGWNWYRSRVEKKPHPKKIKFFFSTLSHGDGTGYVTNGGIFVPNLPKKKTSLEKERRNSEAFTAAGWRPARPPIRFPESHSHSYRQVSCRLIFLQPLWERLSRPCLT